MAPPLTLRETMRAAGNPNLTKWHKGLVDKGAQKKILDEKVLSDASKRDRLQAQVNSLAPDVEHYENRQNQEFQVCKIGGTHRPILLLTCLRGR